MIHYCSFHHSILLWCPWAVYSKITPNSFFSDSLSSIITSDNLHLDLMSCFQSFYPINNRFNLLILLFQKNSSYTLLLHQPTLPNVVFLPCLVFSLCLPRILGFLIDEMSKFIISPGFFCYHHSSLGYFLSYFLQ